MCSAYERNSHAAVEFRAHVNENVALSCLDVISVAAGAESLER